MSMDERGSVWRYFRVRLFLWLVRWTIGFGLIWLVVFYYPDFSWLWLIGVVTALLSLLVILVSCFVLQRKVGQLKEHIAEAEALDQEFDD